VTDPCFLAEFCSATITTSSPGCVACPRQSAVVVNSVVSMLQLEGGKIEDCIGDYLAGSWNTAQGWSDQKNSKPT